MQAWQRGAVRASSASPARITRARKSGEATKRPRSAAFGAPPVPDFAAIEVNSVATAALGDFDRSGAVEARDLTRLLSAWGTGGPLADLDGDGIVAAADFARRLGG